MLENIPFLSLPLGTAASGYIPFPNFPEECQLQQAAPYFLLFLVAPRHPNYAHSASHLGKVKQKLKPWDIGVKLPSLLKEEVKAKIISQY